jgi:hypothetical protein
VLECRRRVVNRTIHSAHSICLADSSPQLAVAAVPSELTDRRRGARTPGRADASMSNHEVVVRIRPASSGCDAVARRSDQRRSGEGRSPLLAGTAGCAR